MCFDQRLVPKQQLKLQTAFIADPTRATRGRARALPGRPEHDRPAAWRDHGPRPRPAPRARHCPRAWLDPARRRLEEDRVESRRIDHALARTSTPMRIFTSGSASTEPSRVSRPPRPRRRTNRGGRRRMPEGGLDVEAVASSRERTTPAATFTTMPRRAMTSIHPPSTSSGSRRRITASTRSDRERHEHHAVRERREHLGAL